MAGCRPRTGFRDLVESAAAAGFDAITLWPNIWRYALKKEGLALADMRAMLDDHGIRLTDADGLCDWVPSLHASDAAFSSARNAIGRDEFFEILNALGGTTIGAVHLTDAPLVLDRDSEGFARLCDDAAEAGLRVALEFVSFSNVIDLPTAWQIVSTANRPNSGLIIDLAHHVRAGRDDAALRGIPADRIFTVQICDGPLERPADLLDEALYHRAMPGTGAFDAPGFLQLLAQMGVEASVGPELYHPDYEQRSALDVMRDLARATLQSVRDAGL